MTMTRAAPLEGVMPRAKHLLGVSSHSEQLLRKFSMTPSYSVARLKESRNSELNDSKVGQSLI